MRRSLPVEAIPSWTDSFPSGEIHFQNRYVSLLGVAFEQGYYDGIANMATKWEGVAEVTDFLLVLHGKAIELGRREAAAIIESILGH
jgi:hypothetical protein